MKISALIPTEKQVELSKGSIGVKGLTLEQLSQIISKHEHIMVKVIRVLETGHYHALLEQAPELLIDVIAMGANAVDQKDDIRQLLAIDQLEIFAAVSVETLPDPKKLSTLMDLFAGSLNKLKEEIMKQKQSTTLAEPSAKS